MPVASTSADNRALHAVRAWTAASLRPADWLVILPAEVQREMDEAIGAYRNSRAEITSLCSANFRLDSSRDFMAGIRQMLDTGAGFAVLDRFSTDQYTKNELKVIYWLLSQLIARPVPQAPDGTLLHDVIDTGRKLSERVRGDLTNQELQWHTDNGFSEPPRYFGLAVLRTAREGGDSKIVNLMAAHQRLAERMQPLLDRLYRPFHWRRIGDYGDGDDSIADYPVYARNGAEIMCRVNRRVIEAGYQAAGEPLDPAGRDAIDALYSVLDEADFAFRYRLEPGQMQWTNNLALAHHRTAFVDWDEPDRRRHLVRIYLRDTGNAGYLG